MKQLKCEGEKGQMRKSEEGIKEGRKQKWMRENMVMRKKERIVRIRDNENGQFLFNISICYLNS